MNIFYMSLITLMTYCIALAVIRLVSPVHDSTTRIENLDWIILAPISIAVSVISFSVFDPRASANFLILDVIVVALYFFIRGTTRSVYRYFF